VISVSSQEETTNARAGMDGIRREIGVLVSVMGAEAVRMK
jgi:hypothetical protein